jgi:hypothetical protein
MTIFFGSGYSSPADVARSKAAGFVAHLAKPSAVRMGCDRLRQKPQKVTRIQEKTKREVMSKALE